MATKYAAEGESLVKEAEKSLKTGLTKWNADFDQAASCYGKAATAFKNAKEPAKSLDCFIKAGECHLKNKVPFQAAKAFEQGAFVSKEVGSFQKASELLNRAYSLYVEGGSQDTAGLLLERGAKMLEEGLPEQAVTLYRKAADLAQVNDKPQTASDMFDRAVRVLVRAEKYNEASKLLDELIQHELQSPSPAARRFVLYSLLVHLKRDDFAAAKNVLQEGISLPDFNGSSDLSVAQSLLQAYDNYDREAFKAITGGSFIRQMDPVYARLARSMDVPEGEDLSNVQRPQTTMQASATQSSSEQVHPTKAVENRHAAETPETTRAPSPQPEIPKPKIFGVEDEDAASEWVPPVQKVTSVAESPTADVTNVEDDDDLT